MCFLMDDIQINASHPSTLECKNWYFDQKKSLELCTPFITWGRWFPILLAYIFLQMGANKEKHTYHTRHMICIFSCFWRVCHSFGQIKEWNTLLETSITPANRPSQKKKLVFQPFIWCFLLLVSGWFFVKLTTCLAWIPSRGWRWSTVG